MLTNLIYFVVFVILAFVLSIAVKAITRGVEAKQILKEEKNIVINDENQNQNLEVINQIKAQLDRMVPVHEVIDLTLKGKAVQRELAIFKVVGNGNQRVELLFSQ